MSNAVCICFVHAGSPSSWSSRHREDITAKEPYNVAAEAKVPFLSIAGSDFVEIYAGKSV